MSRSLPAVLGGEPAFPERLPLVRPTIADVPALSRRLEAILDSGLLTNGPTVRELEDAVAERVGVPVVAVSSCTAGLMLTYQALGVGPGSRVVLPSFTFSASAHAVVWAGGEVDFCEVTSERGSVDVADLAGAVSRGGSVRAVSATHLYGHPVDVDAIDAVASAAGVPAVYDAAHALGSMRSGRSVGGFGTAEVFSLSPTKVVVAGEGGLVATRDASLAEAVRLGRDYGNPGDYDTLFPGLNARMSELHAAVALASLEGLDASIATRDELVDRFEAAVRGTPGIRVIRPETGDTSTFKDLTIVVDPDGFGLDAVRLQRALAAEGVDSRRYFAPPIHAQHAYARRWATPRELPITDALAASVLTPPLWTGLPAQAVEEVAGLIGSIHGAAPRVASALGAAR